MSDSQPLSGPTVVVGDEGDPSVVEDRHVSVGEFFHWIYRFLYSKTVGLVLILLFAAYALVGSVIVQTSAATWADPELRASFVAEVTPMYGKFTPILGALGFFHVFTSLGFYVMVALLAMSILACTAHRIPTLLKRWKTPRVRVSKKFFEKARYRATIPTTEGPEEALAVTEQVLRKDRFRVLPDEKSGGRAFFADRNAWAGIGTVIAHVSFVIILLAFVISARFGVEEQLSLPVDREVELGHDTGLTALVVSFQDTYTEDGQASDYVTDLQLLRDGEVVVQQDVRVNTPLVYSGFRFHQNSFGVAADIEITDSANEVLYSGSVPMLWSSGGGQNAVGKVLLEDQPRPLEVLVVTAASGATASEIPLGTALFQVFDVATDDMVGQVLVEQGETSEAGGLSFTFERERRYTGITMRQDPGTIWMWVGSVLLVVGMSITFLFPYRRMWVRADEHDGQTQIRLGAVAKLDYAYQRLFEKVVAQVDEATESKEEGVS